MKLYFGIVGNFAGAFLEKRQRLLIIAALVNDPSKSILDPSVSRLQGVRFLSQLVSLVRLLKALGIKNGEIIQTRNCIRGQGNELLVTVARLRVIFHLLVNH